MSPPFVPSAIRFGRHHIPLLTIPTCITQLSELLAFHSTYSLVLKNNDKYLLALVVSCKRPMFLCHLLVIPHTKPHKYLPGHIHVETSPIQNNDKCPLKNNSFPPARIFSIYNLFTLFLICVRRKQASPRYISEQ